LFSWLKPITFKKDAPDNEVERQIKGLAIISIGSQLGLSINCSTKVKSQTDEGC
jgi:hypothetical protein